MLSRILRKTVILIPLLLISSCISYRTIYVSPGTPVRLRETLRKVKVWVADAQGIWQESEMDLPEGWYALADTKH